LGVALAGAITVVLTEGTFDLWDSLVGTILGIMLFAYDNYEDVSFRESLAFAAIYSINLVLILFGFGLYDLWEANLPTIREDVLGILLWAIVTLLLLGIRQLFLRKRT
jgi:hypothetical protein